VPLGSLINVFPMGMTALFSTPPDIA